MADVSCATYHALVYEDDGYIVQHWIINAEGKRVWSAWIYDDEPAAEIVNAACREHGVSPLPFDEQVTTPDGPGA